MRTYDFSRLPRIMNKAFYPYLFSDANVLVLWGSGSSGKSWTAAQKLVYRLIAESQQVIHHFVILRKFEPSLEKSAWRLINDTIDAWGVRDRFDMRKKPMSLTFKDNGAKFVFTGLDNPEKIKSIENVTGIWMEECTEFDYEDFMQLLVRLRGKCSTYLQLIASFNPVDKMKWTYNEWYRKEEFTYSKIDRIPVEDEKGNKVIYEYRTDVMHSNYKMNRFLPIAQRAQLEQLILKDQSFYIIYALGDYADIRNKIYTNIKKIEDIPVKDEWEFEYAGLDFGTHDPMALLDIYQDGFDIYFKQIYYQPGKTLVELKAYLTEIGYSTSKIIYCDSASPDKIATLRDEEITYKDVKLKGFNAVGAIKGHGSIKAGIDYLKSFTLHIRAEDIETWNDFYMYKWKEDRNGNSIEEPVGKFDHACDAARYGVHGNYRIGNVTPHIRMVGGIFYE
jgi:phage terminase large subunit